MIGLAKDNVEKTIDLQMETPKSSVLQIHSAYMDITTRKNVIFSVAKYILDMTYTKEIREKEGGTYGVGVSMSGTRDPHNRAIIFIQFDTNPEKAQFLNDKAKELLIRFAEEGPTAEELSMAKENLKKNIPESRINNSYWMNALNTWNDYKIDYDREYEEAVNSVTAKDVKKLLKAVLKQQNCIEFKSMPVIK